MRFDKPYVIFNAIATLSADFIAAITDIITSNAHGLVNGNKIVFTTTTTLPAGLATGTVYFVREVTTNTFKVSTSTNGAIVDITDTGTGTHTFTMHDIGNTQLVEDFRNLIMQLDTADSADFVVKFQGSVSKDEPDFSAAQSPTNSWDYVEVVDTNSGATIPGDTGIVLSGTDDHRRLTVNTDHLRWINAIISGYTAGIITLTLKPADNQ